MSRKLDFRALPSAVRFKDVIEGSEYAAKLHLQNAGGIAKRVSLVYPESKIFSVQADGSRFEQYMIAPGMGIDVSISYFCEEVAQIEDRLKLVSEDGETLEVPLLVTPPRPDVQVPASVSFGQVVADGRVNTRTLEISNNGAQTTRFSITSTNNNGTLVVKPTSGVLEAVGSQRSSQKLIVEYSSSTPGQLQSTIRVDIQGQQPGPTIAVTAEAVEHSLKMLTPSGQLLTNNFVDIGCTYYGTKRTSRVVVLNDGPVPIQYVVVPTSSRAWMHTPTGRDPADAQHYSIDITPNQGSLGAYEKAFIDLSFQPVKPEKKVGWGHEGGDMPRVDFESRMLVSAVGTTRTMELEVSASAVPALMHVSKSVISFPDCDVGMKASDSFAVTNGSQFLPLQITIPKTANFVISPLSALILPGQSEQISVTFVPRQISDFNRRVTVSGFEGIVECNLLLKGSCNNDFHYSKTVPNAVNTNSISGNLSTSQTLSRTTRRVNDPKAAPQTAFQLGYATVTSSKPLGFSNPDGTQQFGLHATVGAVSKSTRPIKPTPELYSPLDPTYMYTAAELDVKSAEKEKYRQFLVDLGNAKKATQFRQAEVRSLTYNNTVDIGIEPGSHIKPANPTLDDPAIASALASMQVAERKSRSSQSNRPGALTAPTSFTNALTRHTSAPQLPMGRKVIAPIATTKGRTKLTRETTTFDPLRQPLSPMELYNVVLHGSRTIDFGDVCEESSNIRNIEFENNLDRPVQITFKSDCKELKSVNNLAQVIPAHSSATIAIVLENITSATSRVFHRGLQYIVNGQHPFDLLVDAKIVPIALQVSTHHLTMPVDIFPTVSGTLTLTNPYGNNARFSWSIQQAYVAPANATTTDPDVLGAHPEESATVEASTMTSLTSLETYRQLDPSEVFSITPSQGTVGPHETLACLIQYKPSFRAVKRAMFVLNIEGNNTTPERVLVHVDYGQPKCVFESKRILLETIGSGTEAVATVRILNNSFRDAFFDVSRMVGKPGKCVVKVEPCNGRVAARGFTKLRVTYKTSHVGKFEGEFQVKVRGLSSVGNYFITGQAEAAKIAIEPSNLKLGRVHRGALCRTELTLTNLRKSEARVVVDLSSFEDWSLVLPRDDASGLDERLAPLVQAVDEEVNSVENNISQIQTGNFSSTELASLTSTELDKRMTRLRSLRGLLDQIKMMRMFYDAGEFEEGSDEAYLQEIQRLEVQAVNLQRLLGMQVLQLKPKGYKHEITIPPSSSIRAFLDLLPVQVAAYDFSIPIQVNNVVCEAPLHVAATVIRAPLSLSTRKIDFGRVFLSQQSSATALDQSTLQLTGNPQTSTVVLTCQDTRPLEFHLVTDGIPALANGDFELVADEHYPQQSLNKCITLRPNESYKLTVKFSPKSEGWFECCIPVQMHDESSGVYAKLELRGWGTLPYIAFSETTVVLPTVPLGVPATAMVLLRGFGYDEASAAVPINCRLPASHEVSPLSVEFPDGAVMKDQFRADSASSESKQPAVAGKVLQIAIRCSSEKPVSFRYQVHFVDGFGRKFPLNIVGNVDSSLATLYPYIADHRNAYYVRACEEVSADDYNEHVSRMIERWFTLFGLPARKPIVIPETLIDNFGATFFDIVRYLSGKDAPGLPLVRPANVRPGSVYEMYRTALDYLKSNGACVSHIQPEHLLCASDYRHFKKVELQALKDGGLISLAAGIRRKRELDEMERSLPLISRRAWTCVLAQTWRAFVLARITPSGMRALVEKKPAGNSAGRKNSSDVQLMSDAEYEELFATSSIHGIHSSKEAILLMWLSLVHHEVSGATVQVQNFGDDLADGTVFASVLTYYVPPLATTYFSDLFVHPTDSNQRRHNVVRVVTACKSIGIPFALQVEDILSPNPIFMVMLCVHLYEILPQYVPRADPVLFSGQLQTKISKQISLSNPTNAPLTYRAVISGCEDFAVDASVVVPANGSCSFPVTYTSRFSRERSATLLLIGDTTGAAGGSVMAFSLVSDVTMDSPLAAAADNKKVPNMVAASPIPCYSAGQITLNVKNPYDTQGRFTVHVFSLPGRPARGQQPARKFQDTMSRVLSKYHLNELQALTCRGEFWCKQNQVHVASNKTAQITIDYVPMFVGDHEAIVWLKDDAVGEMVYMVTAKAILPLPQAVVHWECDGNAGSLQYLHIPYENTPKIDALSLLPAQGRHDSSADNMAQNVTLTVAHGNLLSQSRVMSVEYRGSNCFAGPHSVKLVPAHSSKKGTLFAPQVTTSSLVEASEYTDLEVTFSPVGAGVYECEILLTTDDDIRVFKVLATVHDRRALSS